MASFERLGNGLRIVTEEKPHLDSVTISIFVGVGSRYETEELHGISHFIEHVVFKGTKRWRDSFKVAKAIEQFGGTFNAETGREYTGYVVKLPKEHFIVGLDVLADMLVNPLLRPEDLEKEKEVIAEEIAMYEDTPSQHVFDVLGELMWPDQPLGRNELGNAESIGRMTREDALRFMEQYYYLNNVVVCVIGNIPHESVVEAISERLRLSTLDGRPDFENALENQEEPKVLLKPKSCEETHLCIGIRCIPRTHPDFGVFQLVGVILGGGMMSRLFQEVRDKRGLAYDVSATLSTFQDTGAFIIYAGVDTQRFSESIKVIKAELEKLVRDALTDEELSDAKAYFRGSLSLRLEDTIAYSEWLGKRVLFHDSILTLDEYLAHRDSVAREDIIRTCRYYFTPRNLNLAVISPHSNISDFADVFCS